MRNFIEGGYTGPMVNGKPSPLHQVVPSQLDRIEAMLGALLEALAADEDGDQEEPARTLDGDVLPGERDTSRSL